MLAALVAAPKKVDASIDFDCQNVHNLLSQRLFILYITRFRRVFRLYHQPLWLLGTRGNYNRSGLVSSR